MNSPFALSMTPRFRFSRKGPLIFTTLALLAFTVGLLLLSLVWFGVGATVPAGKLPEGEAGARGLVFILIWPLTMLAVWIFSLTALLLAKRWLLASLALPAALALLFGVWMLVSFFMLNISGVMFATLSVLLVTGAIWLASWFAKGFLE